MPEADPTKERWWYVQEKGTSYALKSELFVRHDDEHLFKASGSRTGRKGCRNWFPSQEEALTEYLKTMNKHVSQADEELFRRTSECNRYERWYWKMLTEELPHA